MSCYCMQMFSSQGFNPLNLKRIKFNDVGGPEETNIYCWVWFKEYSLDVFLKFAGPMVVIVINLIVPMTFKKLSIWEK